MKNYLKAYSFHGVLAYPYSDKDAMGNCRFCGSDSHFSINIMDGRYRCLKCESRGNLYTFMNRLAMKLFEETSTRQYRELSVERGISVDSLHTFGLAWDDYCDSWVLPVRIYKQSEATREVSYPVVNLKRWLEIDGKKRLASTPTTKAHPFNNVTPISKEQLWDCEGEWDVIALKDNLTNTFKGRLIGLSGAGNILQDFDDPQSPLKETINFLFDNDAAGRRGHILNFRSLVSRGYSKDNIKFINWENTVDGKRPLPVGYDIRDLCNSGRTPDEIWAYIRKNMV